LEHPQSAEDHGDEGQVEDQQGDDEGKQVHGQVTDDEEEDEGIDVLRGDDSAQPLDTGTWRPVHQVLLHIHYDLEGVLQNLAMHVQKRGIQHNTTFQEDLWKNIRKVTDFGGIKELCNVRVSCVAHLSIYKIPE